MIPFTLEQKIIIGGIFTYIVTSILYEILINNTNKLNQNLIKESNEWIQKKLHP